MKAASNLKRAVSAPTPQNTGAVFSPSIRGHLEIARIDHWVKNVFVLPGIVVALSIDPSQ